MNKDNYGINWQDNRKLTDLDFADDIAMLAETDQECKEWPIAWTNTEQQSGWKLVTRNRRYFVLKDSIH